MVEHPPPPKNDEQHPLLKVEAGGGDGGRPPAPFPAGWSVTCTPRRGWTDRWPELFSAFWMSGMLLGIFVLIIYGLGTLGVVRRQPLFLLNCNNTRPSSEVHYHYLIEEGVYVPYKKLSEYLSHMGTQYTGINFNVVFLINSSRNRYRKSAFPFYLKVKQSSGTIDDLHMFRDFHLKYHNINITIISLPKFMATTPWRYRWKKIPVSDLIFYLGVYSVWKNGGIGMDLKTFSNQYNSHQFEDPAITTILRQHNGGIKLEEYSQTLDKIDRDEQNEFLSMFCYMVHQIFNETRAFINRSLTPRLKENVTATDAPKPFVIIQINKREVNESHNETAVNSFDVANATVDHINTTDVTILDEPYRNTDHALTVNHNNILLSMLGKKQMLDNKTDSLLEGVEKQNKNKSERKVVIPDPAIPQVLLLYDFSIFSENLGPSYFPPEIMPNNLSLIRNENYNEQDKDFINTVGPFKRNASLLLSIALDGTFVAATSKQHPLLGQLISTACQRMQPRFAIQEAILTQCPALFSESAYCNSIYIL